MRSLSPLTVSSSLLVLIIDTNPFEWGRRAFRQKQEQQNNKYAPPCLLLLFQLDQLSNFSFVWLFLWIGKKHFLPSGMLIDHFCSTDRAAALLYQCLPHAQRPESNRHHCLPLYTQVRLSIEQRAEMCG